MFCFNAYYIKFNKKITLYMSWYSNWSFLLYSYFKTLLISYKLYFLSGNFYEIKKTYSLGGTNGLKITWLKY